MISTQISLFEQAKESNTEQHRGLSTQKDSTDNDISITIKLPMADVPVEAHSLLSSKEIYDMIVQITRASVQNA